MLFLSFLNLMPVEVLVCLGLWEDRIEGEFCHFIPCVIISCLHRATLWVHSICSDRAPDPQRDPTLESALPFMPLSSWHSE